MKCLNGLPGLKTAMASGTIDLIVGVLLAETDIFQESMRESL